VGGLYGMIAGRRPKARAGLGSCFGAALWLISDEIAVPAFGLSKKPTEYPLSTHKEVLAAHIVYGVATDSLGRGVRKAIEAV